MRELLRSVRTLPARLAAYRRRGVASARRAAAPPFRRKLLFEALEPRILLSADLVPLAPAPNADAPLAQDVDPQVATPNMAAVLAQQSAPRSIVFLDASLEQYQAQLGDAQVVLLDPERDGVEQITETLAGQHDIAALHVITHGDKTGVDLGTATLGGSTIENYTQQLAMWRDALTADADILLYGCSIGADAAFLARLGEFTGADVAASTNDTGAAALGGDWVLESSTGPIEAAAFALEDYASLLADIPYQDDWGKTRVTGTLADHNRLNFADVTADLAFTLRGGGNVLVATTDNANTVTASGVDRLVSGQGANRFFIESNKTFPVAGLTLTSDDNTLTYTDPSPGFFSDSSWTTGVIVDLSDPNANTSGFVGRLTAQQLAHFHTVIGGYGNDTLRAGDEIAATRLEGGKGNDTLTAGEGIDTLVGGRGDDTYIFKNGWGTTDQVREQRDEGFDTLDFTAVDGPLNFVISDEGVAVSDTANPHNSLQNAKFVDQLRVRLAAGVIHTYAFQDGWFDNVQSGAAFKIVHTPAQFAGVTGSGWTSLRSTRGCASTSRRWRPTTPRLLSLRSRPTAARRSGSRPIMSPTCAARRSATRTRSRAPRS